MRLSAATLLPGPYQTNLSFAQQLLNNLEPATRDIGRFYFEQSRLSARTPDQQAEWRLAMSELSLAQKNLAEAAALYNQVLTDSTLRNAKYSRGDASSRAAVAAEQLFHILIASPGGAEVYKRYEDQAEALLNKAHASKDSSALALLVECYPNSAAAVTAAT